MHSDFSTIARLARERLPVPALEMGVIRSGARKAQVRERTRAIVACAALAIGAIGAAGLGERLYGGIRIWLSGNSAAIEVRSMTAIADPTSTDLHDAISTATFQVILPTGLPSGTRIIRIFFSPASRPNTIVIDYLNEKAHLNAGFALIDSSVVNTSATLPIGPNRPHFGKVYQWNVGDETVIVPQSAISEPYVRQVRTAMATASAPVSVATTESMLTKLMVLGGSFEVQAVAEALAPPGVHAVLVDRGHLPLVPGLAKQGKPMLDSRIISLSDIPLKNGEPDFPKATLAWRHTTAIPAGGVRAIDAVLRTTGRADEGCCEILLAQPDTSTYWIWEIPMTASAPVRKYAVDARTLAVEVAR